MQISFLFIIIIIILYFLKAKQENKTTFLLWGVRMEQWGSAHLINPLALQGRTWHHLLSLIFCA
ncbi:hypothetical protein JHK87_013176 [Glycine soja]|nr:hypothetical protein JHK87_013176 [Glycine soja]